MSNRLFQGVIHQMKDSIDKTFGVLDENYTVIACSDLGHIGDQLTPIPYGVNIDAYTSDGFTFKSLGIKQGTNYTVFVEGEDIISNKYAGVLAVAFAIMMKSMTAETLSRISFSIIFFRGISILRRASFILTAMLCAHVYLSVTLSQMMSRFMMFFRIFSPIRQRISL